MVIETLVRKTIHRIQIMGLLGASLLLVACEARSEVVRRDEIPGFALVTPGMTQTELESVMGPPTYIQVKRLRQAWQYCPNRRWLPIIERIDRWLEVPRGPFVTVWFNNGQVEHLRVYPGERMGMCEDFLAAFRWEDDIQGGFTSIK
jgi:hypothetical protein